MERYPFILEMWYEEDAIQRPDGSYQEGFSEWRTVGKCNVRINGKAQEVMLPDGMAFVPSYTVVMPSNAPHIPENTRVRAIKNGVNMFDLLPKDESSKTYEVRGDNSTFKQRHENTILWL